MSNASTRAGALPELLEYYSHAAMHHRTVMIAFAGVYFAINQALLLTPLDQFSQVSKHFPLAVVLNAGVLAVFVVAATMHHACHFCSNTSMKALMQCDLHYEYLSDSEDPASLYESWRDKQGQRIRRFISVPTASLLIIAVLLTALVVLNSYMYFSISAKILGSASDESKIMFGAFVILQVGVVIFYGKIFFNHLRTFSSAKSHLALVLRAANKVDVEVAIAAQQGQNSDSSAWTWYG